MEVKAKQPAESAPSTSGDLPKTTTSSHGQSQSQSESHSQGQRGSPDAALLLKEFMSEVSDARRVGEAERVLRCFKLNPYDILHISKQNDAEASEIRRAFRQVSLLVHPDKCPHEHAKQAFELVNKAYKDLQDEELKKDVDATLEHAKGELRRERKNLLKGDNAYLAAAALKRGGAEDLEKEYESSQGFQEEWRKKAQELLTQLEWRRRQLNKRIKGEEQRMDESEKKNAQELKNKRAKKKDWEKGREKRVSSWRDFATNQKKNKKIRKKKNNQPILG